MKNPRFIEKAEGGWYLYEQPRRMKGKIIAGNPVKPFFCLQMLDGQIVRGSRAEFFSINGCRAHAFKKNQEASAA